MQKQVIQLLGDTITVVAAAEETDGALTVIDVVTPPGGGPPTHTHAVAEVFHVIAGELEIEYAGVQSTLRPGETAAVRPGVPHTYRNASGEPVRFLVVITPGGFERFLAELAEATADGPPDFGVVVEVSARHGVEYVGVPAPA